MVELVGGVSVINGAYPVYIYICISILKQNICVSYGPELLPRQAGSWPVARSLSQILSSDCLVDPKNKNKNFINYSYF